MRSEDARPGMAVRVREDHKLPELRGMVGTIMRIYKSPGRTALHVRLEDGLWQVFWPEELEVPETAWRGREVPDEPRSGGER